VKLSESYCKNKTVQFFLPHTVEGPRLIAAIHTSAGGRWLLSRIWSGGREKLRGLDNVASLRAKCASVLSY